MVLNYYTCLFIFFIKIVSINVNYNCYFEESLLKLSHSSEFSLESKKQMENYIDRNAVNTNLNNLNIVDNDKNMENGVINNFNKTDKLNELNKFDKSSRLNEFDQSSNLNQSDKPDKCENLSKSVELNESNKLNKYSESNDLTNKKDIERELKILLKQEERLAKELKYIEYNIFIYSKLFVTEYNMKKLISNIRKYEVVNKVLQEKQLDIIEKKKALELLC